MKVRVVAPFAISGLDVEGRLEVPPGATVGSILKRAKTSGPFWRLLPVSVNGMQVKKSHKLNEDDVIVFISPISGG
jgi:molybdopterin converting factor small subunit